MVGGVDRYGRGSPGVAERHTLMGRRQKAGGPVDGPSGGKTPGIGQHDETGQIPILGAQAVGDPGTHAGVPVAGESRIHLKRGRGVIGTLGHHGPNHAEVVGALRQMRQKIAHPEPTLAPSSKFKWTLHQGPGLSEEGVDLSLPGHGLAIQPGQLGLVVEGVHVTGAPRGIDVQDPLGGTRKMGGTGPESGPGVASPNFLLEQAGQSDGAQTAA